MCSASARDQPIRDRIDDTLGFPTPARSIDTFPSIEMRMRIEDYCHSRTSLCPS
jgi:hypothetical protein